ncbi:MAG: hypothetical protein WA687_08295 [Solirubrobacterales bacterium]
MEIESHDFERHLFCRGGVFPRGWTEGPSQLHAECLIEGLDPQVGVVVQFMQPVERQVLNAAGEPVEELVATGKRHRGGEERVEHEVQLASLPDRTAAIETAGSRRAELVEAGEQVGTLLWRWEPLHATVEAWIDAIGPGLHRVRVDVANRLEWDEGPRERTLMRTLRSTHLLMRSAHGGFASPLASGGVAAA